MNAPYVAVIEDDYDAKKIGVEMLLRAYEVNSVSYNSAEAYLKDAAANSKENVGGCQCLLVDLQLPGMSGLDLVKKVRQARFTDPIYPDYWRILEMGQISREILALTQFWKSQWSLSS